MITFDHGETRSLRGSIDLANLLQNVFEIALVHFHMRIFECVS